MVDAFAEPNPDDLRRARAVLVVHGGRIVAERYADGLSRESPMLGWSMTKSVTNALVGLRVGQGKMDIHAPAPINTWRHDGRAESTVDQLRRMSSGLHFEEIYGILADATQCSPKAGSSTLARRRRRGASTLPSGGPMSVHRARPRRRKLSDVPTDAVWASGYQGQTMMFVPSRAAVIVRLGLSQTRAAFDRDAFVAAILASLPRW